MSFERLRCAISIVAAATCADLSSSIEDDPDAIVFSEPETGRLGFTARHVGLTSFRMARGVVKSFPATRAISSAPEATAFRREDRVNGPCGKNRAVASARVSTSSSSHCAGSGLVLTRISLSGFTSSLRTSLRWDLRFQCLPRRGVGNQASLGPDRLASTATPAL